MKSVLKRFVKQSLNPQSKSSEGYIFPKTNPEEDGEECLHDCDSCTIRLPRKFKIDEEDDLYGHVKGWETHLLVATGKTDWVRDVEEEKNSVMEAVGNHRDQITNGRLMLSATNIPLPDYTTTSTEPDANAPTRCLLLPAFTWIENVRPSDVPQLLTSLVNHAPTNSSQLLTANSSSDSSSKSPLTTATSSSLSSSPPLQGTPHTDPLSSSLPFRITDCPHRYLILLCSQQTRDARCGQSAPLLRREFERQLRPLGLYRDLTDERPGGVGIYFISHVGGHKYSANVMIYRRNEPAPPPASDTDNTRLKQGEDVKNGANGHANGHAPEPGRARLNDYGFGEAVQCIWIARVRPEDCENIVRYTVLQGKVVKPDRQLRGGFDRARALVSW